MKDVSTATHVHVLVQIQLYKTELSMLSYSSVSQTSVRIFESFMCLCNTNVSHRFCGLKAHLCSFTFETYKSILKLQNSRCPHTSCVPHVGMDVKTIRPLEGVVFFRDRLTLTSNSRPVSFQLFWNNIQM